MHDAGGAEVPRCPEKRVRVEAVQLLDLRTGPTASPYGGIANVGRKDGVGAVAVAKAPD